MLHTHSHRAAAPSQLPADKHTANQQGVDFTKPYELGLCSLQTLEDLGSRKARLPIHSHVLFGNFGIMLNPDRAHADAGGLFLFFLLYFKIQQIQRATHLHN